MGNTRKKIAKSFFPSLTPALEDTEKIAYDWFGYAKSFWGFVKSVFLDIVSNNLERSIHFNGWLQFNIFQAVGANHYKFCVFVKYFQFFHLLYSLPFNPRNVASSTSFSLLASFVFIKPAPWVLGETECKMTAPFPQFGYSFFLTCLRDNQVSRRHNSIFFHVFILVLHCFSSEGT